MALHRRSGVRISPAQLDHELAIRGLTARRFGELSQIDEMTLSRARQGRHVKEETLRKIAAALLRIPPIEGAGELLHKPEVA